MEDNTRENLFSGNMLTNLADKLARPSKLPGMSVYQNAREKVMLKAFEHPHFRLCLHTYHGEYIWKESKDRAKIHVYCPPLLQHIQFALALASANHSLETCEFQVVIHPDDRLLDGDFYSIEERHESLLQLDNFVRSNAQLGDPVDTFKLGVKRESRCRFLATRFDQVWIDQHIMVSASGKRMGEELDASEFFRASKHAGEAALMVIMAGPQICHDITRTAPLVGPDLPVQPSQIYSLEDLGGTNTDSLFKW